MAPERWKQVEELYHAALALETEKRAAFLVHAAEGDDELRSEVESLLAQDGSRLGVLDRPAWEHTRHSVAPGTQLGPYRIEALLGAGGMGQVFRGRDTRLDRAVAIKIVAEEFSYRFEREARAISGLNHPHICTLYDVGPSYLVMELVEGETLASRLQRGRLSIELALRHGTETADALAEAHGRGIIHCDLKPGNLMVTKSGIKVLDFGLARMIQPDATHTTSHAIQGTPAYMAPEQLEGKPCDGRTDIYALGLVLYEMATGTRLRPGEAASLETLPERFAHVVARCLEQEPEDRWQSARDVKAELKWAGATAPASTHKALPRWAWFASALLGAGLFAAGIAIFSRRSLPASQPAASFMLSFDQQTTDPFSVPVPSPDGRSLVFSASDAHRPQALWIRPLDSLEARRLPGTEGATSPFWSPDGRWIGFVADGKLRKISPSGGPPLTIAALPELREGAAWGANGDIIYAPDHRTPLYRIHESGGSPRQVTNLDRSRTENSHRAPTFLPDGRRFLFTARCGQREHNALYLGSLDSPEVRRLMTVQSNVRYIPPRNASPGALVYYRDGMLVSQPFDVETERPAGEPTPITQGIAYNSIGALASFEVSSDASLVILRPAGGLDMQLTWFDRIGEEIGVIGPRDQYFQPRLSPNGDRIAFSRPDNQTGNPDIWFMDVARGTAARLTTHGANDWFPNWSHDGKQMVFWSDREGGAGPIIKRSMDPGSHESRLPYNLDELATDHTPYDWSRDGRWISVGNFDIWVAFVSGDRKPFPFLATVFNEGGARFSPDGKWIAYTSDETGRSEIYVRPFTGAPAKGEGKIQISNGGGDFPVWRADGQELFYMAGDLHLYAVSTKDLGRTGAMPLPKRLFRACPDTRTNDPPLQTAPWTYPYDTRDGQRFVVTCRAERPGRFVVLMNWAVARP